jgi:hypothetical protein
MNHVAFSYYFTIKVAIIYTQQRAQCRRRRGAVDLRSLALPHIRHDADFVVASLINCNFKLKQQSIFCDDFNDGGNTNRFSLTKI